MAQRVWPMPRWPSSWFVFEEDGQPFINLALLLADLEVLKAEHGQTGAVIAAVFEPPQSLDENRRCSFLSDVSDNAAHNKERLKAKGRSRGSVRGRGEIVNDRGAAQLGNIVPFQFSSITSADENTPFDPGIPATFEVNQFVANHIALRKVQAELVSRVKEELRRRLSPSAGRVRGFRSDVDLVEPNAGSAKLTQEMLVNPLDVLQGEVTTTDSRLVGDNEKLEARILHPFQGLGRSGENHHVFRSMKIVLLLNHRAVAVQKNCQRHAAEGCRNGSARERPKSSVQSPGMVSNQPPNFGR